MEGHSNNPPRLVQPMVEVLLVRCTLPRMAPDGATLISRRPQVHDQPF